MFTAANMDMLTRSELWSTQLKDILLDKLEAQMWVNWLSDFPDGTTFTIPSVGEASVQDIVEDVPVNYESMDTGEFQFTITEYIGSAHYITRKQLQDAFYANQLIASFIPKERRAIDEKLETDILALAGYGASGGQTILSGATDANAINGADHRFIGTGTNETMAPADFAKAKFALKKANVPMDNLVAIVDPTVGYALETATNLVNVSNNPQWEGIIETGITTGMRFIKNVYGFDCYESNYVATDQNETDGTLTTASGVANTFFSASAGVQPFVGAWRQMPIVDSEFNKDLQREEYLTTARYGLKVYRPENLVVVVTDNDQV